METGNTSVRHSEKIYNASVQLMDVDLHSNGEDLMDNEQLLGARDGILLTTALQAAQLSPDIRSEKVAALKAKLAAGKYQIDDGALAEAILREEGALFSF